MSTKKIMTAKEFDTKFWQDNDPFTTPIWKELRAYYEYGVANSSNVIHDVMDCGDFLHEERVTQNDDKFCPLCGKKLQ